MIQEICGFGIHLQFDGFRIVYTLIACFMWLLSCGFSLEYMAHYKNKGRYYSFLILTFFATAGVFLSADLYTTFIFFEIMSFTSYVWVAQEETPGALRAGSTYLAIAVMGGLVMLMGLFLTYHALGTLNIDELRTILLSANRQTLESLYPAGLCMLFGFGAKAGAFPLHIWLPKAHPVAPAPASALLSGILTKAGVFGMLVLSGSIFYHDEKWATLILGLGVITMFLGALLALFSINIKRTLACSSLSQIGFIMVGIGCMGLLGEENLLAVQGTFLHMVNHSLIKLVLFMAAGVIYMNIHNLDLNVIRGFGRNKVLFHIIFIAGAVSIMGVPFIGGGYLSKTLLHEGIVEYTELLHEGHAVPLLFNADAMKAIEWIFLVSGGLTVAYMTKLYICVFVEKNADSKLQEKYDSKKSSYMNPVSTICLLTSAVAVFAVGQIGGSAAKALAAYGGGFLDFEKAGVINQVNFFSLVNLKGAAVSILIGAAVYLIVVRGWMIKDDKYLNRWDDRIDLEDTIYRPVLLTILPFFGTLVSRIGDTLLDSIVVLLRKTIYKDSPLHEEKMSRAYIPVLGNIADFCLYIKRWISSVIRGTERPEYARTSTGSIDRIDLTIRAELRMLSRGMSFGLMLFCIGFILTILYLLFI